MDPDPEDADELGGDPACWLDRVCESCGALIETGAHVCPDREPPAP
ncbi:MAG TPA: hypothetical protein VGO60_15960 [Iamia sp.]|nr:hypothetical protein [Iamia sp.]